MTTKRVVHRRYSDKPDRPDLRELVLCNNINGPLKGALLTGDPKKVTCGRCIRIRDGVPSPHAPPFSEAAKRRISRSLAGPPKKRVWNSGTEREEDEVTGRAPLRSRQMLKRIATGMSPFGSGERVIVLHVEPQLAWEKQSFKRYTAQGLGGAKLEIVKSGTKTSLNETWHPVVFGNRFAYAKSFERWAEAAAAAERLAITYAQRVLDKLEPVVLIDGGAI